MFTGIIEETGTIQSIKKMGISASLKVGCRKILKDTKMGDSIAVNGICLTVKKLEHDGFWADVMIETMRRSSLSLEQQNAKVNLERAMGANGRFGGHLVSGHIDGTGRIQDIRAEENAVWYTIQAEPELLCYMVEKGSIAVDGISLTIASISATGIRVSVIPHTRQETALIERKIGDKVNLECDVIGKYVRHFLEPEQSSKSTITEAFLTEHGFY